MSYFSEDSQKTAMVVGGLAVGGLAAYYLWDRYHADSATWQARRDNAAEMLKQTERKAETKLEQAKETVKEAAHKAADKVAGAAASVTGKNAGLTPTPAPVNVGVKSTPAPLPVVAPVVVSTAATTISTLNLHDPNPIITEPELKKVKERAPVVQEVVHPVELEEVQPRIHREIKKVEVHQITQPIYEEYTAPLKEYTKENIAEHRPTIYEQSTHSEDFENGLETGSKIYEAAKKTTIFKPAIIEEVIKTDIIEVIQPVIHRDTVEPIVVHTNQPIYEKIREQPTIIHEVRKPIILTHDDVERLEAAKGEAQLEILERFSQQQGLAAVADRTYETTTTVVTETTSVVV